MNMLTGQRFRMRQHNLKLTGFGNKRDLDLNCSSAISWLCDLRQVT